MPMKPFSLFKKKKKNKQKKQTNICNRNVEGF